MGLLELTRAPAAWPAARLSSLSHSDQQNQLPAHNDNNSTDLGIATRISAAPLMLLVDCRNDTDTAGAPHHVTNASPRLARQAELCCRSNIMQSHALAVH
ncbi:BQ5605_C011g06435 [Microbotryum silenes-dioicae]|uniref:BQ5605_C011g06435 protein n=1 Tax=Microbotryum silenes-dioicae TaxID=796604 RepID=A0A2X0M9R1_9BASI|nr:BQ5605_C011g06435 [Microbotryum silenes-dioicae]